MKERGKLPRHNRPFQLPLAGWIILCLLAMVYVVYVSYLVALARFVYTSVLAPSQTIVVYLVDTNPNSAIKHWTVANMRAATDADQQDSNASDLTQKINASLGKAAQQEGQPHVMEILLIPSRPLGKSFLPTPLVKIWSVLVLPSQASTRVLLTPLGTASTGMVTG